MDKSFFKFLPVFVLLSSCSVGLDPDVVAPEEPTFAITHKVSLEDAYEMASLSTKGVVNGFTVEPVIDSDGDTLMFFVNYESGWEILSADKRTPATIAKSNVGSISLSTDNPGLLAWLDMTAGDMKRIIHLDDSKLNFSAAQIKSHRQQWSREPLRFPPDTSTIIYEGDWVLVSTETEEVYYDHVDHLVGAHWDQSYPYNYYCPPKNSGTGNQPVGCSPVACAQVFQFLCSHFGLGMEFSWNGLSGYMHNVHLPHVSTLYEYTTPLLLRYVGVVLGANYGDNCTSVTFAADKIQNFYSSVLISSTKQSYSAEKVKQNLTSGMPILVSGYSGTILGYPDYSNGHTYIIDGYKRYRTKYTYYYERLTGYPPLLEEKTEIEYSSPHIGLIKMNWGWHSQWTYGTNDVWFALTGDWYVDTNSDGVQDENFTEGITILCDFEFIPYL